MKLLRKNSFLIIILLGFTWSSLFASSYFLYQQAEKARKRLLTTNRINYRSNWIRVINLYINVGKKYPKSKYASCAFFEAGELYLKLAKFSGKNADAKNGRTLLRKAYRNYKGNCAQKALYYAAIYDYKHGAKKNALRIYKLLKKKHPGSPYITRLEKIILKKKYEKANSRTAEKYFKEAERAYSNLIKTDKKQFRYNWINVMRKYKSVIRKFPNSYYALRSYIKIGFMYEQLYRYSLDRDDLTEALKYYNKAYKKFPARLESAKALWLAANVCLQLSKYQCAGYKLRTIVNKFEKSKYYSKARKKLLSLKSIEFKKKREVEERKGKVLVKGVRYWSSNNYTRVVIYSDTPFVYEEHYLPSNPKYNKPPRFYFDISNAVLDNSVPNQIAINDGLLRSARVGQFKKDVVRVVLDLQSVGRYTAFTLEDPFRLVIDVFGKQHKKKKREKIIFSNVKEGNTHKRATGKKYVYVKRRIKIVLDPGHGGKDTGAVCCGIREKDITLSIAKKLAHILRSKLGADVILTRDTDVFIPLEERTALANTQNADAFISIHVNSTPQRNLSVNKAPSGAIVFYLGKARDFSARRVARIENQSAHFSRRKDWIGSLINELEKFYKRNDSILLARSIQKYLNSEAENLNPYYRSHRIEGAPFYVLVNTSMPAVLVETGFINNPVEGKLLTDSSYQEIIADSIYHGIKEFFEKYVAESL